MGDPREVPPRCHQRLESVDRLSRASYVCTFADGHTGMHSGKLMAHDSGEICDGDAAVRWGTPAELDAEIEATRSGDWREALERAWDAGALHERSGRGEENPYKDNKEDRSVKGDPCPATGYPCGCFFKSCRPMPSASR